jgi:hypothetical protein
LIGTTWLVHVWPPSVVVSISWAVPFAGGAWGVVGEVCTPSEHTVTLEQDIDVSALPVTGSVKGDHVMPPSTVL